MTLIKGNSVLARRAEVFRGGSGAFGDHQLGEGKVVSSASAMIDGSAAEDRHRESLSARIAELEAMVCDAEVVREEACADAFQRGYAEGMAAAACQEDERIAVLTKGLRQAVAAIGDKIDKERDVAIDIARAAVDRMVSDPSIYHELVAQTAQHHAAVLRRSTLLRLRVSAADFPDTEALAASLRLGENVAVEADRSLEAGSCIFDLTLGSLDASLSRQRAAIQDIFDKSARVAASL